MIRAYAQLLRIPNVFTAFADILLGWLAVNALDAATRESWESLVELCALLAASGCLYSAGMVWNDFFDVEEDRRERPFRPIPSGRVTLQSAGWLGSVLVAGGLVSSLVPGLQTGRWQSFGVAALLGACVLLYDAWLKRTPLGPVGMGLCRFLNVLLGMSAGVDLTAMLAKGQEWQLHLAGVVGLYIVGVTWFARTEAVESRRGALIAAAVVMLAAVVLALELPIWWSPTERLEVTLYPYLLVLWAFIVGVPVYDAMRRPQPKLVQRAIKRCVLGLIGLDALLAIVVAGWIGLAILLLLVPALLLGRWVYST